MKKIRLILKFALPLGLLVLLSCSAGRLREACFEALLLCGRLIIPSLFPFFVLSAFINKLSLPGIIGRIIAPLFSRLYGISVAGASALVIGFLGGYPSGAAYIADMERNGQISAREGERLVAFCNNSGPAFIVGVMGTGVFSSVKIGLTLYAVHICSALVTGLFFRGSLQLSPPLPHSLDETDSVQALVAAVKQSVSSIVNVCGFVLFFSVLLSMLGSGGIFALLCGQISETLGLELSFVNAAVSGILELGNGAGSMQGLRPEPLNLALAAGMLSWGGLSVHFQTLAVLSESRIKGSLHLAGRLISAIIASLMMFSISRF